MVISFVCFAAVALIAGLPLNETGLTDADVARVAEDLLRTLGPSDEDYEIAAFVVRDPGGALVLQMWPNRKFRSATWSGPKPKDLLAVIHTHPIGRRLPSRRDIAEAKRLGVPFYVVSRVSLCVAEVTDGVRCASRVPWMGRSGKQKQIALNWRDHGSY